MIRRTVLFPILGACLALGVVRTAMAGDCPVPGDFVIPGGSLPATAAAIRTGHLRIVALGGGATLGSAARDPAHTYPSRLATHLGEVFPGIEIAVATVAIPRQPATALRLKLEATLSDEKPALVVWGPGGREAARGDDLETFNAYIGDTIARIRASGADPILMTLQYAPSIARVVNLYPYRVAILRAGESGGIPVLDRYELMRYWSETGYLDLDTTADDARVKVAREVYDCMAKLLAKGIADAIK